MNADTSSFVAGSQPIGRDAASILNPFIGVEAAETMYRVERAVRELVYAISAAQEAGLELDARNMIPLFDAACFALRFEVATIESGVEK